MFNNISLKLKMALMVVVPIFVIFITLGLSSYKNYKEVQNLSNIELMVSFATKASELVHNLQKERGSSAGFISSKGEKFSSELELIRKDTDKTYKEIESYFAAMNIKDYEHELQSKMQTAMQNMQKLKDKLQYQN